MPYITQGKEQVAEKYKDMCEFCVAVWSICILQNKTEINLINIKNEWQNKSQMILFMNNTDANKSLGIHMQTENE